MAPRARTTSSVGLGAGDPPEFWNADHPDRVRTLHQQFVDAGADIILTNTFGCNRHRLKLHGAEDRVFELAKRAAELACEVADAAPRAGGGRRLDRTHRRAVRAARRAHRGGRASSRSASWPQASKAGGADVAWIETMSAAEEIRAAATAAFARRPAVHGNVLVRHGRAHDDGPAARRPVRTCSTACEPPVAIGANCGVGASDILVSLLAMTERDAHTFLISKGNCGVPYFAGTEAVYTGHTGADGPVHAAGGQGRARASSAAAAARRRCTSRRCGTRSTS